MDEKKNIHMCKKGELDYFDELYLAYVNDIYRFVFYRVRNKERAEDITSDVFFKALKGIGKFDEKQSFRTWIYTIARNTLIDDYRKKKDVLSLDEDDAVDVQDEVTDVEREAHNSLLLEQVQESLEKLTESQKEIVVMRVWDGLSYKEIAEIVGKTEGNCKMIFSRAISQVRDMVPLSVYVLLVMQSIEI